MPRALAAAALLWACAAFAQDELEPSPKVVQVEVHLPRGVDPSGISEAIAVARGQPLSKAAVRRSIERLYFSQRFSDIVVRQEPAPGGVKIVFDLTPRLSIGEVHVDGERALTEKEILAAARLKDDRGDDDAEYYPEVLEQAQERIRALYFRRGFRQAQVEGEAREGDKGVMVLLTVDEGFPTPVQALTFGGNPGLPVNTLTSALNLKPGDVLDLETLERGLERLKALYREKGFYRARIGDPEVLDPGSGVGAVLALPVNAGPQYVFHFHGNKSFPDKLLRGVLAYDGTESLDRVVLGRMARRVASFYRFYGFHDVAVTPREVRSPSRAQAVVAFDVVEGPALFVRQVQFEGNTALSDAALRRMLADQIRAMTPLPQGDVPAQDDPLESEGRTEGGERPMTPEPDPLTVFVPEAYAEATKVIREAYRERGFLSAKVEVPDADIDVVHHTATVTVKVVEGPQALVRQVKYLGLPPAFDPKSASALRLGEPFRYSGLDETTRALTRALGREGYLFARVEPEPYVSEDGQNAQVIYRVDAGPRVRVGQVVINGLNRTEAALVRANLVVREGAILDPEALFESQRNLVLLGVFRTVAVRLRDPDAVDKVKDVLVDLRERPRIAGEVAGGYSLVDGPRIVGDVVYPNLFGTATSLTGRLKLNYIGASALVVSGDLDAPKDVLDGLDFRGNIAVAQPRLYQLLPARVGTRLDLIGERVHRPAFSFLRYSAVAGADWAALDWLTLSLQYEIEHDRVELTPTAQSLIFGFARSDLEKARLGNGIFTLHSLRPTLTLDFRDDFARPTRGVLFSSTAELTKDIDACETLPSGSCNPFPISTLKLAGSLTGYVPVAPRVVLAVSARGGKIFHLEEDSRTIAPKRFFLGGASSMRGFPEDGLVPEDRRTQLRQDLVACRSLVLPYGCTPEANWLRSGEEVPSDGGELFSLLKSELRFPAFGSFDLGVFFEAGNLWLKADNFDPLELRYVAGAGIRYATPIGPIALDLGVNLLPDDALNERRANVHFSIGLF